MKAYALVNAIVMQLSIPEQSVKSLDVFVYEWKKSGKPEWWFSFAAGANVLGLCIFYIMKKWNGRETATEN